MISYWVNNGATVVLAERHPDPATLMNTIVHSAEWLKPNCKASIMCQFNVPTTDNMTPDNPLGEWHESEGCVIRFAPPKGELKRKKHS